jgi:hypothetical protein
VPERSYRASQRAQSQYDPLGKYCRICFLQTNRDSI